jgi:hypothetical protein
MSGNAICVLGISCFYQGTSSRRSGKMWTGGARMSWISVELAQRN